jgi:methylated-DNA-[protein]-cysteine S-methyltransferase
MERDPFVRGQSYPAVPPLRWETLPTDAGPVSFATDGNALRAVRLGAALRDGGRATPLDRDVRRQLEAYFAGRLTAFDLPWSFELPAFTTDVLEAVARIPFGAARSYGDVARDIGRPRAARAVGQAVGANVLPLVIPCHRVLAAHGRLGGFGGGLAWKRFLLRLEGIGFRP